MTEIIPKQEDSKVRGIIFMNLFCICTTAVGCIFKKLAEEGVSNLDFAIFRALVGLFCISLYNWYLGSKPWEEIPRRHYAKMFARSLGGTWGFILYTYIITILPLTLTTVVFQTNPFWMSVLGICFLGERIMKVEIIGIVLCFGGVVMVTLAPSDAEVSTDSNVLLFGVSLCLVMAWTHSFVQMFNRMMRDVPWYTIMFWHSTIGLCTASIIVGILALINGGTIFSYSGRQYGLLVLCAFLDFLGLSCSVITFQSCEMGFISLFGYLIVVYSFLADLFVFHETFGLMEICGTLVILTVTMGVGLYKYWLER